MQNTGPYPSSMIIVYRKEFYKTRWSCPWSSDQNFRQNSVKAWQGSRGGGPKGGRRLWNWGLRGGGSLKVAEGLGVIGIKG